MYQVNTVGYLTTDTLKRGLPTHQHGALDILHLAVKAPPRISNLEINFAQYYLLSNPFMSVNKDLY
jgi:hypothetical protein